VTKTSAEGFESQFWNSFDNQYKLTENEMREELPNFISDSPGRQRALMGEETTHKLD
jgi:hypothetical protein